MLDAPEVLDILLNIEGAYNVELDQCLLGLRPPEGYDNKQDVRVMKPTLPFTNIPHFAKLNRNCGKAMFINKRSAT